MPRLDRRHAPRTMLFGLSLLLAACGGAPGNAPQAVTTAPPAALAPDLQAVYDRSCGLCHSVPGNPAPQAGDRAAWAPRVAQGGDVLLEHAINGFNAMPPLGQCMDCNRQQFRALIDYMAGTDLEH